MNSKTQQLSNALDLLSALAQVQRWEAVSSGFMRSLASRELYFGLIRHLDVGEGNGTLLVDSMKEIYYDEDIRLTERGIRLTIRAFEADGAVVVGQADDDRRSRRIFLTPKLQEHMLMHAEVLQKALNKNHLVIKK